LSISITSFKIQLHRYFYPRIDQFFNVGPQDIIVTPLPKSVAVKTEPVNPII